MTIYKAKGQIVSNIRLYLPQHVFSHGQLYVALSRGISMMAKKVLVTNEEQDSHTKTYTWNIVYKEV